MNGSPMKQGLIIVDLQKDYFPGGNFELVGIEKAANNAQKLLRQFREQQAPIFHIQHLSMHPDATFFLPDTQGAEIHGSVAPQGDGRVFVKHFPNSFRDTELLSALNELDVERVVICGAMSHMCIDATVRTAFDLGFQCIVIEDACATRDLDYGGQTVKAAEVQTAFMAALTMFYAKVIATDEFLRGAS
jgi:nicotinamidase-related amidase